MFVGPQRHGQSQCCVPCGVCLKCCGVTTEPLSASLGIIICVWSAWSAVSLVIGSYRLVSPVLYDSVMFMLEPAQTWPGLGLCGHVQVSGLFRDVQLGVCADMHRLERCVDVATLQCCASLSHRMWCVVDPVSASFSHHRLSSGCQNPAFDRNAGVENSRP